MTRTWGVRWRKALGSLHNQRISTIQTQTQPFWKPVQQIPGVKNVTTGTDYLRSKPAFCTHSLWDLSGRWCHSCDLSFPSVKEKRKTHKTNFRELFFGTKLDICKPLRTMSDAWKYPVTLGSVFFLHKLRICLEIYRGCPLLRKMYAHFREGKNY